MYLSPYAKEVQERVVLESRDDGTCHPEDVDAVFVFIGTKPRSEPLARETSAPGVFAAGDVRAGAMNRVASSVGEGSMAVRSAHDYLALT